MFELLKTKLFIPRPRKNLVSRPRLIDCLNAGLDKKLTLIAAPAGFGKTTLLSEWIPQSPHCVTWLSLDEDDNDPVKFWAYFIKSLQRLREKLGEGGFSLLQSPQAPPINSILTTLMNDIASFPDEFSIVLDDYHVIESQSIHEGLTFLLDHQPVNMHLMITTRMDPPLPLARLRAKDQLTELRANDLRFTADETASFLNHVMGLSLSAKEVVALEARTEGWIAGLQIAALSMQGQGDIQGFIQAFSGSHRHILGYLAEEVLNQQPQSTLNFLLQTSILDRLCGPLCDAVTGETNSQRMLEELERANLFVIPLDDERKWFRYHHLFGDLLRYRLNQAYPDRIPKLRLNASQWYEQAGFIDQAVQHALAAQSVDRAAMLVEKVAPAMIQRSELARLLNWLDTLPNDVVQSRPLLALYYCWGLFLSGQITQAETWLQSIETMSVSAEIQLTAEAQGHIAAIRSYLMLQTGDFASTIDLSRQALAQLPEQDVLLREMVALNLALAHYIKGDFQSASQLLTQIIARGKTDLLMANTLSSIYLKAYLLRAQGRLKEAFQLCQDGLDLIARRGWQNVPAAGFVYIAFGDLLRERNEHGTATEYLEKGIELGKEGAHPHILIVGHVWLSLLQQAEGDEAGSHTALQSALQVVQQQQVSRFWPIPYAASYQARLWIAQGDLTAAERWAGSNHPTSAERPVSHLYEIDYIIMARLRIAQGDLGGAEGLLSHLHEAATKAERNGSLIEILVLQAITFTAQRRNEEALSTLAHALGLAEGEGYIRIFIDEGEPMRLLLQDYQAIVKKKIDDSVDRESLRLLAYIENLLATFPQPASPKKLKFNNIPEPLSERELDILRLIATGSSNKEIAENLIIAVSTVKTHINNIYGKLGTSRRTQAIAIAREKGLL
jgi:LuxR family maltose regulon positive regulatory protein